MSVVFCQDPNQCTFPKVLQLQEADAQWNTWEMAKDTDKSLFYMVFDHVLHIRIATKFMCNFRTSTTRQNRADALVKSLKKADEKTLAEEASKLGTDMNRFGAMDVDMFAEGAAMLKAGVDPHNAFADMNASIPEFTALLTKKPEKKTKADGNEADEVETDDDEDGDAAKKCKRGDPNWWARDEYILAKEAEVQTLVKADADKFCVAHSELLKLYTAARLRSMS